MKLEKFRKCLYCVARWGTLTRLDGDFLWYVNPNKHVNRLTYFPVTHLVHFWVMHKELDGGFPRWLSRKISVCHCRRSVRCEVDPWLRNFPMEGEMETHSRITAWKVPWTQKPGMLCPWVTKSDRMQWIINRIPKRGYIFKMFNPSPYAVYWVIYLYTMWNMN